MDRVELSIDGTGYLSSLRFFSSLLPHLAPLHSHLNFSLFLSFFFFAYPFQIRINFYHSRYKYLETIKRKRIVVEKYINFVKYVCHDRHKRKIPHGGAEKEFIVPFVGKKTFNFRNFSARFLCAFHIVLLSFYAQAQRSKSSFIRSRASSSAMVSSARSDDSPFTAAVRN